MLKYVRSVMFILLFVVLLHEESFCEMSESTSINNVGISSKSIPSVLQPTRSWYGTKPPFPRSTVPTTLINTIKFPLQLVELENGKRVIIHHRPQRLYRAQYCYPLNYNISTLFEILDEVIYNALADPEVGFSFKVFRDINMFQYYLKKVKKMFIDKIEPPLDAVKFSIYRLYLTKGGPSFTQFPIDDPECKRTLTETFEWNDENFETLRKQQKLIETMWNRIQTNIFDMNMLSGFRGSPTMRNTLFTSVLSSVCISHCALLVSGVVPVFQDPEDNQYERADEVDLSNSTTLLDLDSYIYNVMVDPTKGTGEELLNKLDLLTHCMRKARTMFVYGNEEADYGIRAATLIFYNSGGPTLSRIPLYDETNTAPIKREFNWTDDDIKHLEQKQLEAEAAWNKLRRSIL